MAGVRRHFRLFKSTDSLKDGVSRLFTNQLLNVTRLFLNSPESNVCVLRMTLEDMGPGVLYPLRSMEKTCRGTEKRSQDSSGERQSPDRLSGIFPREHVTSSSK